MGRKACPSRVVVDGFSMHADIADLFASKYHDLFDPEDMVKVNTEFLSHCLAMASTLIVL